MQLRSGLPGSSRGPGPTSAAARISPDLAVLRNRVEALLENCDTLLRGGALLLREFSALAVRLAPVLGFLLGRGGFGSRSAQLLLDVGVVLLEDVRGGQEVHDLALQEGDLGGDHADSVRGSAVVGGVGLHVGVGLAPGSQRAQIHVRVLRRLSGVGGRLARSSRRSLHSLHHELRAAVSGALRCLGAVTIDLDGVVLGSGRASGPRCVPTRRGHVQHELQVLFVHDVVLRRVHRR